MVELVEPRSLRAESPLLYHSGSSTCPTISLLALSEFATASYCVESSAHSPPHVNPVDPCRWQMTKIFVARLIGVQGDAVIVPAQIVPVVLGSFDSPQQQHLPLVFVEPRLGQALEARRVKVEVPAAAPLPGLSKVPRSEVSMLTMLIQAAPA